MINFAWLKRYMPTKLFGRTLIILIIPVFGIQLVVGVLFIQRHFEGVTRQMAGSVGSELTYLIATVDTVDPLSNAIQLEATADLLGFTLDYVPGGTVTPGRELGFLDVSGREMERTLRDIIARPMRISTTEIRKSVRIDIQTDTGLLTAIVPQRRMIASNPHLLFTWTILTSLVLLGISILFLRNQVRPIRKLALAAEAFGKGQSMKFRPQGAEEVRRAGAAFLAMRQRLERQIESRTAMLSGVSHDLRTPLTRMRLALAVAEPSPEVEELQHDVEEMERMLEGFLAFARGEGTEETADVDATEFIRRIAQDARREGAVLTLNILNDTPNDTSVPMREMALGRAVRNLVSNAIRHGDEVRLTLRLQPSSMEIAVADDGPGIPEHQREEALKAFTRLDAARNQDQGGGVGLGLSIAADVARGHGGKLVLGTSQALGGLRAAIRIPR
ncbi:two-component system osmolarity sensor histidine kinase EnvZ [Rubricella aquisinus]|uniref:histidine kinase n=1 Tax=Rubricella aquisinus TaxID=2028108 RepID=A0A840WHR2_9RHOB|nr:ATP-binding protein [Rubricella aquisinus]MBB5514668.1 two-component system osmolarity sensor histidine kinase EnvZ [Rubricella aquisinus]